MSILLTALFTQTFTDITVQPVSINTTLNSTVLFICEAITNVITFRVNGEQENNDNVIGFTATTSELNGTTIARLQAIGYDFNNNTEIQCRASNDAPPTVVFSDTALLLIQGLVVNLNQL